MTKFRLINYWAETTGSIGPIFLVRVFVILHATLYYVEINCDTFLFWIFFVLLGIIELSPKKNTTFLKENFPFQSFTCQITPFFRVEIHLLSLNVHCRIDRTWTNYISWFRRSKLLRLKQFLSCCLLSCTIPRLSL